MKPLASKLFYAVASAPLIWVAWFYFYVFRQRIHYGHWPRPYNPDPKDAEYILHHLSIYLGVVLVPLACLAAILLAIHRWGAVSEFRWWLAVIMFGFGLTGYVVVIYLDPGSYWAWFRD